MKRNQWYEDLVTVASKQQKSMAYPAPSFIQPQTLLKCNRELATNSYVIHNIHQLSDRFSKDENL